LFSKKSPYSVFVMLGLSFFDTRIIGRTEKAEAFDLFWTE